MDHAGIVAALGTVYIIGWGLGLKYLTLKKFFETTT
jgi:hypothetical protein